MSVGWISGIDTSMAPARSISSRMTCSTLRRTRRPTGRNVYRPPVSLRTRPARSRSWCDTISASDGVSLSVGMKVWDQSMDVIG